MVNSVIGPDTLDQRTPPLDSSITGLGNSNIVKVLFGLKNAPATFQWMMQEVLSGLERESSAYIDDI